MNKPIIGITMGDPAGIGPEVIAGAWQDARVRDSVRPIVIGHPQILRRACDLLEHTRHLQISEIDRHAATFADLQFDSNTMHVINGTSDAVINMQTGQNSAIGGQAAYDCLLVATELAQSKKIDAIVTAPLSKAALHAAGKFYPGHTELLGELCGVDKVAMLLYLAPDKDIVKGRWGLGVAHVTLHISMRQVFDHLTVKNIVDTARLLHDFFGRLQSAADSPALPRLAIAALNCHGGEAGLFGDEEITIIGPAVKACCEQGMHACGPLPCDTLMKKAADGEFDGVVAMYHDQGHIALKLLGMHRAVNVTLGLPIVRTSVAHGTAYDIAWQGKSNPNSMVEAILVAAKLV